MKSYDQSPDFGFRPPSEQLLSSTGTALFNAIKMAIRNDQLLGIGSSGDQWILEIEGSGALADKDGYVRTPQFGILRAESMDTDTTRAFIIINTRTHIDDESDFYGDLYKADILKNTEIIDELSKASLDRSFIENLDQSMLDGLTELKESNTTSLVGMVAGIYNVILENVSQFGAEVTEQMKYGQCDESETIELIELLQRARPLGLQEKRIFLSLFTDDEL